MKSGNALFQQKIEMYYLFVCKNNDYLVSKKILRTSEEQTTTI